MKNLNYRAYAAEFLGTFLLAFLVRLSLGAAFPIPTPLLAGLTLALIVYTLGPISGAHVNPAVTLALASVKKISSRDAALYIVAQFLGAFVALLAGGALLASEVPALQLSLGLTDTSLVGFAEAVGAVIFLFGIASIVYQKAPGGSSGAVIGGSLLLGILAASVQSNGVLNPAVALAAGSFGIAYVVGPIVGGVIGVWVYRALVR